MQLINGALSLNATLLLLFALFGSVTVISPFTKIDASLKSHESALISLIPIFLLALHYFLIDCKLPLFYNSFL